MKKLIIDTGDFDFKQVFSEYKNRYDELVEDKRPSYLQSLSRRTKDEITTALHEVFLTGLMTGFQGKRPSIEEITEYLTQHNQAAAEEISKKSKEPLQSLTASQVLRSTLSEKYSELMPLLNRWLLSDKH